MNIQDPIADMFTRIRNAQARNKLAVSLPFSKQKVAICELLEEEGFIDGFEKSDGALPKLTIKLKYHEGIAVIDDIQIVSRPGLRVYKSSGDIPRVYGMLNGNSLGVVIVSTSKGLMTGRKARKLGLGGEIFGYVA